MLKCDIKVISNPLKGPNGDFIVKLPAGMAKHLNISRDGSIDPMELTELFFSVLLGEKNINGENDDYFLQHQKWMKLIYDSSQAINPK